jgi:diol dehydratase reactivase alpha subunit
LIAGVDIGNSTTEVCLGSLDESGRVSFVGSAISPTTGTKGTVANVHGIKTALDTALKTAGREMRELTLIRINEAAPVIGDTAMETITETIITESSMIGHNPATPAGAGQAVGYLIALSSLDGASPDTPYIVTVPRSYTYETVAERINRASARLDIRGIILQADEAVLVANRLKAKKNIPIIDEVRYIERLPEGKLAAIEVALPGQTVRMLSNPYGIATLLGLDADETRSITPIAKSLIGKRSAVVIKTPGGNVHENVLKAGSVTLVGDRTLTVDVDEGAERMMQTLAEAGEIRNIEGQSGTNVGLMLDRIRTGMASVSGERAEDIRITDLLAVDTMAPVAVSGAIAGETCMEKAVGIAAMVRTRQLPMQQIADALATQLGTRVLVAGVEAVMAALGALTTPGTRTPLAILDMGGGSTDAALIDESGGVRMTHCAGAGELVSMLIQTELGLASRHTAEQIKKYPVARVESLFHLRLENGGMQFFDGSIDPRYFGHVVLLSPDGLIRIDEDIPMEKIVEVRREAKHKVFVTNALRALRQIAPNGDLKRIPNVVLVGGSAEDFEIPEMLMEELASYRIVCGRANIRATEGPRNAVATGLVLSYLGEKTV